MASILSPETQAVASVEGFRVRYAPAIAVTIAVLGILAVHADTAASIVAIWYRSETFAHGYAVVPICLWLAWRRRRALARTPAMPWLPALAAVAGAGAFWLVMSVAEVLGLRQFALVFMLQGAIVAVAGLAVARATVFPLLFLLFAVPAGELFVPTMIDWTADFTVAALRASGVPVFREANHFVIPTGAWSVVEACSGLRYLIASVMIGVVYATVSYRSPWRRAAFIGASIVVPLVANWLRAYMIVMIGHLSNNRLAVGVDHLIYGWVFFGVVMALLFWVGSFWHEPEAPEPQVGTTLADSTVGRTQSWRFYAVAVAAIALAAIWRPVYATLEHTPSPGVPMLAPLGGAGGFTPSGTVPSLWTPGYHGHVTTLRQGFVADGAAAGVFVAYYRDQSKGQELVTSGNQLVPTKDLQWREVARGAVPVRFDGAGVDAMRSVVSGPRERLVAYRVFWIGGAVTTSDYVAKARLGWSKLTGRGDDAALVVFFAREREDRDVAREALEALSPQVSRMLAAARESR